MYFIKYIHIIVLAMYLFRVRVRLLNPDIIVD